MNTSDWCQHGRQLLDKFERTAVSPSKWEKLSGFVINHFAVLLCQKATQAENAAASAKEAHQKVQTHKAIPCSLSERGF